MSQAPELSMHCAEHRVIGMAGVAGAVARDKIILKMLGGNVAGIVDCEAFAEIVHNVT